MSQRLLIRDAIVVSMDPVIGVLPRGSLFVEDGRIVDVRPDLEIEDCQTIDGTDQIVLPGLIDAHRHLWYSPVRGDFMDGVFAGLLSDLYPRVVERFTAPDLYAATRAGLLMALDRGVTTVFDWCHALNSPEHVDAAVQGHLDMPARGVFGFGASTQRKLAELQLGRAPADSWELARQLRKGRLSSDTGRLTMALALQSPDVSPMDQVIVDVSVARELQLPISMHVGTPAGRPKGSIDQLAAVGLLDHDMQFVHCCSSTDAEFGLLASHGCSTVICPSVELLMGTGVPPIARAHRAGLRPAFGTDSVVAGASDLLEEARIGLALARAQVLADVVRAGESLVNGSQLGMSSMEALAAVTIHAAAACGLERDIGSLTPGKRADVIMLRAADSNLWPMTSVVQSLVGSASGGNVEFVIVDGSVIKANGRFVELDPAAIRADLQRVRDHLNTRSPRPAPALGTR
ncbi:MAG TPA: amidohydrolase family protein [Acidothermaceae bacterium]|jgi:cytosine/adenosine deaminase-related metal-dependent hydrolase